MKSIAEKESVRSFDADFRFDFGSIVQTSSKSEREIFLDSDFEIRKAGDGINGELLQSVEALNPPGVDKVASVLHSTRLPGREKKAEGAELPEIVSQREGSELGAPVSVRPPAETDFRVQVETVPVIADGEATTVELNSALQVEIGQRTEEEAFVAQGDIGPHIPVDSSLSVSQIQAEIVFVEVTASDETPDACQSLSKLPVGLEEQVRVQETRNASISTCCFF